MLKRILALCLCLLMAVLFTACKKDRFKEEEVITPAVDLSQEQTTSEEGATENPQQEVVDRSEDNSYPIKIVSSEVLSSAALNANFNKAVEIYTQLSYNCVPVDWDLGPKQIKIDGSTNTYFRVSDSRFDSVEQLEKYLKEYFTDECIKTFYNPKNFADYEGHLYAVSGTGSDYSLLAGCSFAVTKQTTMRVFFTATVYNYKKMEDTVNHTEYFTEAPKDASVYDIKTVDFVYEITSDKTTWKFSKFGNIV